MKDNLHPRFTIDRRAVLLLLAVLALLVVIYYPTLLRHPGSGENPYMDDVGEIQVALNVWGTVHFTGYPLYTILGNVFVSLARAIGIDPATAPPLYSLAWGVIALAIFYLLLVRLTGRALLAAAATLILGLVRSIWIHNVIAEVYSMTLAIQITLLAVALWSPVTADNVRRKIWWLALLGGIGVAHHRMVAFMAPGLLVAVLPALLADRSAKGLWRALVTVIVAVPIVLIGLLPYLYLPIRALAGSEWVYGDPRTWQGFWHEFSGAEVNYLLQLPGSWTALLENVLKTFEVVISELTPPVAVLSGLMLLIALSYGSLRREVQIALLCALGYFAFLFIFHRAVMPEAVAMFIAVVGVSGLAIGAAQAPYNGQGREMFIMVWAAACMIVLVASHRDSITSLVGNQTGVGAIARAKHIPRDEGRATLMLPWSSRYTAVAFSKYVTSENADLNLAKHTANFREIIDSGRTLYTFQEIFFRFPLRWWDEQLGRVYLSAVADGVVAIQTKLPAGANLPLNKRLAHGVALGDAQLCRDDRSLHLRIIWQAQQQPDADLSVFVHLLGADSDVPIAQADSSAPVYGWYPTTRWTPGEQVRDYYTLPDETGGRRVRFGLYMQPAPGQFTNYEALTMPVKATPLCDN